MKGPYILRVIVKCWGVQGCESEGIKVHTWIVNTGWRKSTAWTNYIWRNRVSVLMETEGGFWSYHGQGGWLDANWVLVLALNTRQGWMPKGTSVVASPKHWQGWMLECPIGNWWGLISSQSRVIGLSELSMDKMWWLGECVEFQWTCWHGFRFCWVDREADWGSVTSIVQVSKPYSIARVIAEVWYNSLIGLLC